jgi:hypothetical protein
LFITGYAVHFPFSVLISSSLACLTAAELSIDFVVLKAPRVIFMDENTVNTSFNIGASKTGDDVTSTLARAFEAFELKNFNLVIELAQSLLRTDRNTPQAHYLIGRVTIETQQLDIAVKALETAVQLDASLQNIGLFWPLFIFKAVIR